MTAVGVSQVRVVEAQAACHQADRYVGERRPPAQAWARGRASDSARLTPSCALTMPAVTSPDPNRSHRSGSGPARLPGTLCEGHSFGGIADCSSIITDRVLILAYRRCFQRKHPFLTV
jgi:hypothetical protein